MFGKEKDLFFNNKKQSKENNLKTPTPDSG